MELSGDREYQMVDPPCRGIWINHSNDSGDIDISSRIVRFQTHQRLAALVQGSDDFVALWLRYSRNYIKIYCHKGNIILRISQI